MKTWPFHWNMVPPTQAPCLTSLNHNHDWLVLELAWVRGRSKCCKSLALCRIKSPKQTLPKYPDTTTNNVLESKFELLHRFIVMVMFSQNNKTLVGFIMISVYWSRINPVQRNTINISCKRLLFMCYHGGRKYPPWCYGCRMRPLRICKLQIARAL